MPAGAVHPPTERYEPCGCPMSVLNEWALVLAGGNGERLRALTTAPCGTPVPKQYCSLQGKRLLIEDAIKRGMRIAITAREAGCAP